jgi:hypothetical protein
MKPAIKAFSLVMAFGLALSSLFVVPAMSGSDMLFVFAVSAMFLMAYGLNDNRKRS